MLTDEFGQRVLGVPTLIKHMTNQIKLIYKHLYEGCQKKKNYKTFCKNTLCICISHPISSRKKKTHHEINTLPARLHVCALRKVKAE